MQLVLRQTHQELRLALSDIDGTVFGLQQEFGFKIEDRGRTALCDKRNAVMGRICVGVGLL